MPIRFNLHRKSGPNLSLEGDVIMRNAYGQSSRKADTLLWTLQVLLAALFLFAGGMKLVTPIAAMAQQTGLPGPFLRFIGLAEVLGALGLILPGLLRIRPGLAPLAAAGLVIIMTGAVGVSIATAGAAQAVVPAVVGILAASVAIGRWRRELPVIVRRPRLETQAA
jgi:uncharacterized membrane protein YphA (DoxX/SURF4 family)